MRIDMRSVLLLLLPAVVGTLGCAPHVRVPPGDPTELQCADVTVPGEATDTIGPGGGQVRLPRGHGVTMPAGALNPPPRQVRLTELPGRQVGFNLVIMPAAPQFGQDVWITISIANCTPEQVGDTARWKIHKRPGIAAPGEVLPTGRRGNTLWAVTRGNSFFIVAD